MEKIAVKQVQDGVASYPIVRIIEQEGVALLDDIVIVEHQIMVYVNGEPFVEMTCSPFELRPLILGYLYSEGYIGQIEDVRDIDINEAGDVAVVALNKVVGQEMEVLKVTSYGKKNRMAGLLQTAVLLKPIEELEWEPDVLLPLSKEYFKGSGLFQQTGGVHSCILVTCKGQMLYRCDDIGRHNALDKVVGMALQDGVDISKLVLYTSGRVPVDMMKKMIRSRIPVVISHSAVTGQAIELAKAYGITLIGFARNNRCNLYAGNYHGKSN